MTLAEHIVDAIKTADTDQAERLERTYLEATDAEQRAIDRVFIALCGWSLRTLFYGEEVTMAYNPFFNEEGHVLSYMRRMSLHLFCDILS